MRRRKRLREFLGRSSMAEERTCQFDTNDFSAVSHRPHGSLWIDGINGFPLFKASYWKICGHFITWTCSIVYTHLFNTTWMKVVLFSSALILTI